MPEVLPKAGAPVGPWNWKEAGAATAGPPKGFGAAVVGVEPPNTGWLVGVPEAEAAGLPNIPELEPKGPGFEEAAPNTGTLGSCWAAPNGFGDCEPPKGFGAPKLGVLAPPVMGCPKVVAGKA